MRALLQRPASDTARARPVGRGPRASVGVLLLLGAGSGLLSLGVVLAADAAAPTPTDVRQRQARPLPWVPNAPLQRTSRGIQPCVTPDEPAYGIIDPCPAVDWGAELEIRRAGGIRARRPTP